MNDFNVIVTLLGGGILALGLVSQWLAASPVPATLVALILGVVIGPTALNLIDLSALGDRVSIMEKAARLALGIGLVGVALRIPSGFPRNKWREMVTLIGLGMPLMWLISTSLVYLVLGLPFWLSALIGAVVTPTDPVAASSIVTGEVAEKNIPPRIRHTISFDSGANDGLAYLFVFLPFLMLTKPVDEALSHFIFDSLLWGVGIATLFGMVVGYVAARLLQAFEERGAIKSEWRLVYTVALAFFTIGAGRLLHSDEVLVAFAAAATFDQIVNASDRENEEHGQEAVNRFFAIPIFVLLGIAIPWEGWATLGWSGVLLACAVMLFRRPITVLMLRPLLTDVHSMRDALFIGWFGPIAVAAVYYSSLMEHKLGEPLIWHVASLVACVSVLLHGVTGAPLTKLYGKMARKNKATP